MDCAQRANRAGAHQLLRAQPLRVMAVHEGLHQLQLRVAAPGVHQQLALGGRQPNRLFAQHMLARLERLDGPRHMQMIGQRVVNGLHLRVSEQCLVAAIAARNPKRGGCLFGGSCRARANRHHCAVPAKLHRRNNFQRANFCRAQNSPANFLHCAAPCTQIIFGCAPCARPAILPQTTF